MLNVRRAAITDVPSMMELERAAAAAAHWSAAQYNALFTASAALRIALVAEGNGESLGFVIARGVSEDWELENIVVSTGARRRGVGARLLAELIVSVKSYSAKMLLLEVRESNQAARDLYRKCGFAENGRRKTYYRDPVEDAVQYGIVLQCRD